MFICENICFPKKWAAGASIVVSESRHSIHKGPLHIYIYLFNPFQLFLYLVGCYCIGRAWYVRILRGPLIPLATWCVLRLSCPLAPRLIALPLALCTAPDLWLAAAWQLRFLRFCRHSFNPYPTQFTSVCPSILGFGLAFLTHSNLTATCLGTHLNIQPFEHFLGPWWTCVTCSDKQIQMLETSPQIPPLCRGQYLEVPFEGAAPTILFILFILFIFSGAPNFNK